MRKDPSLEEREREINAWQQNTCQVCLHLLRLARELIGLDMGTELIESGIVKQGAIDITQIIIIGVVAVVLFMVYILVSKNFVNMGWAFNVGLFFKYGKKYRTGDILRFGEV